MRRPLMRLGVFWLLGGALSLAVAWTCALILDPPVLEEHRVGTGAGWGARVGLGWPAHPQFHIDGQRTGYRLRGGQTRHRRPDPVFEGRFRLYLEYRLELHEFGWPLLCLRWERTLDRDRQNDRYGLAIPPVLEDAFGRSGRRLPLRPLWPGALVNALGFGLACWLLVAVPRATVRGARALLGRCPGCGYDLRGALSGGCPECGWRRDDAAG